MFVSIGLVDAASAGFDPNCPDPNDPECPGIKPPVFEDPVVFCTTTPCSNSGPLGIAIGDLIGDDDFPDVAVANRDAQSVTIFRNTGNWSNPQNGLEIHGSPIRLFQTFYEIEAGDLDGDGDLDLAVTIRDAARVIIIRNDGGSFVEAGTIELSTPEADAIRSRGIAIDDFDQDGQKDIAVAAAGVVGTSTRPRAHLLWNDGGGLVWNHVVYAPSVETGIADATDLRINQLRVPSIPGRNDIVVGTTRDNMFILLNDGGRSFNTAPPQDFVDWQPGTDTNGIAIGKLRAGNVGSDIVATSEALEAIRVHGNDSAASFEQGLTVDLTPGRDPYGVAIGRINPDTKNDVVIALQHGAPCLPDHGGIAVLAGRGDGTFHETLWLFCTEPGADPKPCIVELADMDQDGFLDIVCTNTVTGKLAVLINAIVTLSGS